jgi:hypothetical protein
VKTTFQKHTFSTISITLFLTIEILTCYGFSPANIDFQQAGLYTDDFEQYVTTKMVRQAYNVWDDGAKIDISLENKNIDRGANAMRIQVVGPNAQDGATSGSMYRSLPLTERDWSNSAGIRFWINNPSQESLWLTFNFKEAYNEYWSVNPGSPYLLENEYAFLEQRECQYGNMVIPPEFKGRMIIPIRSFSVPDWNTARGDKKLQLSQIESYAIGVTLHNDFPRTFYIDTIEVLPEGLPIPVIQGVGQIEIPSTGELVEKFKAVDSTSGSDLPGKWSVDSPNNPEISIVNGALSIPATANAGNITIHSRLDESETGMETSWQIKLTGGLFPLAENATDYSSSDIVTAPTVTAYDRFAHDFEKWSMENRPWFVLISVSLVVFFIFILSRFQNRLK